MIPPSGYDSGLYGDMVTNHTSIMFPRSAVKVVRYLA